MKKFGLLMMLSFGLPVLMRGFSTLWEYPTEQCHKTTLGGSYIDFEKYNITTNTNFTFNGDKIVIFYEDTFGLYPYYENYDMERPVNGGLPQKCDLNAHLKKARKDIEERIPNKEFSGLAIIDFEKWRPLFSQNDWMKKRVFQNESIRIYSGTPTGLNINDADYYMHYNKAEVDFNRHAKLFFLETIELGKTMRKKAKWGFYGFPYCNYDAGKETYECHDKWKTWNNEMDFIFQASQALFPSVYLGNSTRAQEPLQRFRYVQAVLQEARRISKKHKSLPIYVYTKFEYDQLDSISDFYDVHDLCAGIAQPVFLGVDGLILWSSSKNMKDRCAGIKKEVEERVGPLIKNLTEACSECSKELCNNTEKCIRIGFERHWCPMPNKVWDYEYNKDHYACECTKNYKFQDCIEVENGLSKTIPIKKLI